MGSNGNEILIKNDNKIIKGLWNIASFKGIVYFHLWETEILFHQFFLYQIYVAFIASFFDECEVEKFRVNMTVNDRWII